MVRRFSTAAQFCAAVLCVLSLASLGGLAASAQDAAPTAPDEATVESIEAIRGALDSITEKMTEAERIRQDIESAETDVDKAAASKRLEDLNDEIAQLERQIESVATGVTPSSFDLASTETFDLQTEMEQLVEPFVLMMKSATENARAIEGLKRTLSRAERHAAIAETALRNLAPLSDAALEDEGTSLRITELSGAWQERRDNAQDLASATRRQLTARLAATQDPTDQAGSAFQSFFSERGRNLAFGLVAFAGVFFALRLVRRGVLALIGAPRNRTVPARLAAFIFDLLTLLAAFGAMLSVFNLYNDWLLTGLSTLLMLALGWFVLRSGPSLFEQITLLLNLGAVQEGERVVLHGVPWSVKRLDFYTILENPALTGGDLALPIRELSGLHSRPSGENEDWFPSKTGDVVRLENGLWGEVIFQSPEQVQIRDEGGSVTTLGSEAYLAQNPTNLSRGFEVETLIGVDYAHQAEAVATIPEALKRFAEKKLAEFVPVDQILRVESALIAAGASSLDIELTARFTGDAALGYDDLRHALARIAVECCQENNWTIPFSTITLRNG